MPSAYQPALPLKNFRIGPKRALNHFQVCS